MPNYITIEGGIPTGKPRDWDEQRDGPCGTLSVLYGRDDAGHPIMTSASQFTPAELQALEHGGAQFLQIYGHKHPVIAMWVQDATGKVIGLDDQPKPVPAAQKRRSSDSLVDGIGEAEIPPQVDQASTLVAALAGAMQDLDAQADGPLVVGEIDDAGLVFIQGTVNLKSLVEAALEAARPMRPAAGMVEVPIMTLDGLGAQAQASAAMGKAMDTLAAHGPDEAAKNEPAPFPHQPPDADLER